MTNELTKFLKTCDTLAAFAPEKGMAEIHAAALDMLGISRRTRERKPKTKAEPQSA